MATLGVGALNYNPNKDAEVTQPPDDAISCVAWSSKANLLVAGSWDTTLRCWEISPQGASMAKAMVRADGPVLCCAWSGDGTRVFLGGCDNKVRGWQLGASTTA